MQQYNEDNSRVNGLFISFGLIFVFLMQIRHNIVIFINSDLHMRR